MSFKPPSPQRQSFADSSDQGRQASMSRALLDGTITGGHQDALSDLAISLDNVAPCPQTPTSKCTKLSWHGLPSPQTLSCSVEAPAQQSATATHDNYQGSSKGLIDDFWTSEPADGSIDAAALLITSNSPSSTPASESNILHHHGLTTPSTSIKGDTDLTLELLSPSSIRRSTRLQNKCNTQPEPTTTPFEVAITSNGELPALHSTEWQLRYPPGGSTHPSYPWPSADPRLVFHAHFVPLNNGLPSAKHMTNLALPMGWRHTSWSGLYPVVFDPHQQVFKLTPIGALPLTSEELHQGGLQDYAPCGKLHPEFGLLPLLSAFSDGSNGDVFNFEGVSWKLPWAQIEGLPEDRSHATSLDTTAVIIPEASAIPVIQLPPRYIEARDCPDDVFDLQDGWWWLLEMEQVPPVTFTPTPGRKWRGTGVQRTPRKIKQPIAALMAITMAESEEDNAERYLGNQNTREFCPFKSVATPVHINITLLQDVEFTLVELLSYFPLHYQWRKAGDRMARAGMSATDISNFVNMTRCLPGASVCSHGSVDHHVFRKIADKANTKATHSSGEIMSYTAEHWTYTVWEMTDYPLLALTHGLVELPSGVDAGPLTAIIKWVRKKGRYRTMLSEAPVLMRDANIESRIDSGTGFDPDKEVLARHIEAIRKDSLRVIRKTKELDTAKEMKPRKRKFE
ncbi:hypothetical protein BU25DRAFT_442669 [Macroventuria anomochaeta]|uniref:Uncharacterized protein n=1 Tax=Macroventuria anomochaeta TaxID=301207 RepID=A0ACB6RMS1_9PLEO|nr:uncharacterized protein BU25DRAFT_442669 [Macroventuria anomochaeta]KAF2623235.1 hypothetical protein BU25DRAFT_442669 [Macroventuria anomochaeta]